MKTSTSGLRTLLHGSRDAAYVDLVTVTLADATVARWTTGDGDLVYGGNTYTAGGTGSAPILTLSKIREAIGLEVSTLDLTLGCGSTATMGGTDLRQLAVTGGLDDARVTVQRAYSATPGGAVVGAISRFSGLATDCEVDSYEVRLRVQSDIYRLEELLPRHLIREKCIWAFGDAGCGITPATYAQTATVAGGDEAAVITDTIGSDRYFDGGVLTFTSGALSGLKFTVWVHRWYPTYSLFYFTVPLVSMYAVSDTISVTPNCDKTYGICDTVFSNTTRRRGFDFVPPPDSVG